MEFVTSAISHYKKIKWIKIGKKVKTYSCTYDDMNVNNSRKSTCTQKKLLELVSEFSEVTKNKVTI
jgi:hypothetical protein